MIEAQDLRIGRGRQALPGRYCFQLPRGECWAIVGRNGSGKSTLLATLSGQLRPHAGDVRVCGRALGSWRRSALAQRLGYLPQTEPPAFPYTIEEFVRLARVPWGGQGHEEADTAIAQLQLELLRRRPLTSLSGGELQRACLAHLLAQSTGILLLDEPLTHLDLLHQLHLLALLRARADAGHAVALVTHELAMAWTYCDRYLVLGPEGMRLVDSRDRDTLGSALAWAFGVEFTVSQHGPCLSASGEGRHRPAAHAALLETR